MRRLGGILKIALVGSIALVLVALSTLYIGSEYMLRRTYATEARDIRSASSGLQVGEGERLATLMGCNGCHERSLEGSEFFSAPNIATLHASNLTRALPHYSSVQLEAAVRQGVRPDGRSLFGMPSASFVALKDEHLAAVEAFLRTRPPAGVPQPALSVGLLGRVGLLIGEFEPEAARVAQAAKVQPYWVDQSHEPGRYLSRIVCSECHGLDLKGGDDTPDLSIAGAYDLDAFKTLMRTGIATGNRELGLMSRVARSRFVVFTDDEIAQLHAYLVARAERVR